MNSNNKYSKETITTFNIISSYFVDIYYKKLYIQAKQLYLENKFPTITDAYKHIILQYYNYVNNSNKFLINTLSSISTSFHSYTSLITITPNDCLEILSKEFIPPTYFSTMKREHKHLFLLNSLQNVLTSFNKNILENKISLIIDNHQLDENINILVEDFSNLLKVEKDTSISKFINYNKQSGNIDKSQLKELKTNLFNSINENNKLKKENNELKKQIDNNLNKKFNELKNLYLKLSHNFKNLQIQNNLLHKQNNRYLELLKEKENSLKEKENSLKEKENSLKEFVSISSINEELEESKNIQNESKTLFLSANTNEEYKNESINEEYKNESKTLFLSANANEEYKNESKTLFLSANANEEYKNESINEELEESKNIQNDLNILNNKKYHINYIEEYNSDCSEFN